MGVLRQVALGPRGTVAGLLGRAGVLFLGLGMCAMSALDLREAARLAPLRLRCADWLANPSVARWVSLEGCHLDLQMAASRRWKGFWFVPSPDGGSRSRLLELFVPLSATETRELPVRAIVATSDAALLARLDDLTKLDVDQVAAYLEEHRAELQEKVEPAWLTGYVEPVASMASRAALKDLDAEGAVVLQEGREPPRANGLFGVFLGLSIAAGALLRPILRARALRRGETLDEEDEA